MKKISRLFESLRAAERFQNSLYNKHDSVRLLSSPLFSENGLYIWLVN